MHNTALLLCNYRIIADKCTSAMNCLYENFNKLFKEYGFPGETQEDHEELMEFVDQMEFDRLGVFTGIPVPDVKNLSTRPSS